MKELKIYTNFTRQNLHEFKDEVLDYLKGAEVRFEVKFKVSKIVFDQYTVTLSLDAQVMNDKVNGEKEDFVTKAEYINLKPEMYGKVIKLNEQNMMISGINLRATKQPVILTEVGTNRKYKVDVMTVIRHLAVA